MVQESWSWEHGKLPIQIFLFPFIKHAVLNGQTAHTKRVSREIAVVDPGLQERAFLAVGAKSGIFQSLQDCFDVGEMVLIVDSSNQNVCRGYSACLESLGAADPLSAATWLVLRRFQKLDNLLASCLLFSLVLYHKKGGNMISADFIILF